MDSEKGILPKISIDKLSFTGRIDTSLYTDMLEFLELTPFENEYRHMPWNFLYQHQWNFKEDKLFIQIGTYERERVFRMEFNPNNIKNIKLFYDIVKRVKMPNVTRIDWAVDYEKDLSACEYKMRIPRKTIEYKGRSGKIETLYLGSPKSDKFTRAYNKALEKLLKKRRIEIDPEEEIEVQETLWRVESVVKDFQIFIEQELKSVDDEGQPITIKKKVGYDYLFDNPFKNLAIYEKVEETGEKALKWEEKAKIQFLMDNPHVMAELPANTRKKYKTMMYSFYYRMIDNQPADIFEKEKNRLANEVESLLKPALDNTTNISGDISNVHYSIEFLKYLENGNKLEDKKPLKLNSAEKFYEENKGSFDLSGTRKKIIEGSETLATPDGNYKYIGNLDVNSTKKHNPDGYNTWLKWIEEIEGK